MTLIESDSISVLFNIFASHLLPISQSLLQEIITYKDGDGISKTSTISKYDTVNNLIAFFSFHQILVGGFCSSLELSEPKKDCHRIQVEPYNIVEKNQALKLLLVTADVNMSTDTCFVLPRTHQCGFG